MASRNRTGTVAFVIYMVIIHLMALGFVLQQIRAPKSGESSGSAALQQDSAVLVSPGQLPIDTAMRIPETAATMPSGVLPYGQDDTGRLLIPVAGVKRNDLLDTYTQSRSGGRVHNAIDIMAPQGTPVVAVADGEIAKFFDSKQGGITIYQWSEGRRFVYYYAHLQRRADGIAEKAVVKKGTVLGYVGDTGNAGTGNFHLHFGITIPASTDRHWEGTDVNPYPLLHTGIEVPAMRE